MTKTGTSYIQGFFKANSDEIKKIGIEYPKQFLSGSGHHQIGHFYNSDISEIHHGQRPKVFSETKFRKYLSSIQKNNNVIISSESLFWLPKKDIKRFLANFEGFEVLVVAYIREVVAHTESGYGQGIKQGSFRRKARISEKYIKELQMKGRLNRYAKLKDWESVVGRNNLIIRPFDRPSLKDQDVLSDFLRISELDLKIKLSDYTNSLKKFNQNISPSSWYLEKLRLLNRAGYFRGMDNKSRKVLIKKLDHILDTNEYPQINFNSSRAARALISVTSADEEKLIAEYFPKQRDVQKPQIGPNNYYDALRPITRAIISWTKVKFYIKALRVKRAFRKLSIRN